LAARRTVGGEQRATVVSHADAVAGLIASLDPERAVLIGQGLGGQVASSVFQRHREQVAALVLAGISPDAATPEEAARRSEEQLWIQVEGDLQLLVNRMVDMLVGDGRRCGLDKVHVPWRSSTALATSSCRRIWLRWATAPRRRLQG
jgi:pimeloyl-ACP methyl ester carboxylesterase